MNSLRRIASLATLIVGLSSGLVHAQDVNAMPPVEEVSEGQPLYGYIGTAFLCAGAMFILCKSARR